jgi:sugar transferase (PEP-CTERM system associated)
MSIPAPRAGSKPLPRRTRTLALGAGQALLALDCLGLLALWPVTLVLAAPHLPKLEGAVALVVYPLFALAALYALGLYRREAGTSLRRALGRVPLAATASALAASGAMLLFAPDAARLGLAAGACVLTGAAGARVAFDSLRRRGLVSRRLLILGAGHRAWDLVHILAHEGRTLGYQITFLHDPALGTIDPRLLDQSAGAIVTAGPGGIRETAMRICPDEIVVAPDERRGMDLHGLLDCKIKGFPISEYLGFLEREVRRVDIKRIELGWLLYSDGFHMGVIDRTLKRLLDLAISVAGLMLLGPFILAAAIAVRLEDGGPALYRQTRVTLHGREFQILKLRTMRTDAERGGAVWAATGDKRVTRLGNFLRRTRLDELPQLINVLRGEMSFVGPRPERPEFVAMLASHLPLYHERHAAKAGLTGWAQINYPYGASIDDARSKLSYDLYYVKNFSVLFDLLIILQTVRVVLWPSGVR